MSAPASERGPAALERALQKAVTHEFATDAVVAASPARVCVRQNYVSVPDRYASRRLAVRLSATTVEILDPRSCQHPAQASQLTSHR